MSSAGDLTQELRDIAWKYQSSTSGVETQAPRWQTCLSKSVGAFGFAAAHEYVIANFEETQRIVGTDGTSFGVTVCGFGLRPFNEKSYGYPGGLKLKKTVG